MERPTLSVGASAPAVPAHPRCQRTRGAVLTDLGPDGPNLIAWLGLTR